MLWKSLFLFSATSSNIEIVTQFLTNAIFYKLTKKGLNNMSPLLSINKYL